jgi:nickel superoxide dismutase
MKILHIFAYTFAALFTASSLSAHCQVPCGIFSDELKFSELEEHVVTIEKSARLISELSAKEDLTANDYQQLVRWTKNKETHAQKIIDETANYFLAQRIKTDADHYAEKMEMLHHVIVHAMKTKQSTGEDATTKLIESIAAFKDLYLDHSQAN